MCFLSGILEEDVDCHAGLTGLLYLVREQNERDVMICINIPPFATCTVEECQGSYLSVCLPAYILSIYLAYLPNYYLSIHLPINLSLLLN